MPEHMRNLVHLPADDETDWFAVAKWMHRFRMTGCPGMTETFLHGCGGHDYCGDGQSQWLREVAQAKERDMLVDTPMPRLVIQPAARGAEYHDEAVNPFLFKATDAQLEEHYPHESVDHPGKVAEGHKDYTGGFAFNYAEASLNQRMKRSILWDAVRHGHEATRNAFRNMAARISLASAVMSKKAEQHLKLRAGVIKSGGTEGRPEGAVLATRNEWRELATGDSDKAKVYQGVAEELQRKEMGNVEVEVPEDQPGAVVTREVNGVDEQVRVPQSRRVLGSLDPPVYKCYTAMGAPAARQSVGGPGQLPGDCPELYHADTVVYDAAGADAPADGHHWRLAYDPVPDGNDQFDDSVSLRELAVGDLVIYEYSHANRGQLDAAVDEDAGFFKGMQIDQVPGRTHFREHGIALTTYKNDGTQPGRKIRFVLRLVWVTEDVAQVDGHGHALLAIQDDGTE
jgi:hypothetical protein